MALRKGWSETNAVFVLAIAAVVMVAAMWSLPGAKHEPARTSSGANVPLFAPTDSARPSATGQELIGRFAKDNGISEEQARQALRQGGRRSYSAEEVDRVFGK